MVPVDAETSFPAGDPHQPTVALLRHTFSLGRIPPLALPNASSRRTLDKTTFPAPEAQPLPGRPVPGREARGSAPGRVTAAARTRPAALGPFESPARAGAAGRAREARRQRGRAALARTRRGQAGARAPRGAGNPRARTRAFLPPGFTWGRRRQHQRAGNGPGPPGLRLRPPRAPPSAPTLRPDPPPVTGATYLAAGPPQATPPLAGPAANCPRACALQAFGPDPGPERKTKSPAAPGGRPAKCKWRARARALLTRLSPPLARGLWVCILEAPNPD